MLARSSLDVRCTMYNCIPICIWWHHQNLSYFACVTLISSLIAYCIERAWIVVSHTFDRTILHCMMLLLINFGAFSCCSTHRKSKNFSWLLKFVKVYISVPANPQCHLWNPPYIHSWQWLICCTHELTTSMLFYFWYRIWLVCACCAAIKVQITVKSVTLKKCTSTLQDFPIVTKQL